MKEDNLRHDIAMVIDAIARDYVSDSEQIKKMLMEALEK